MKIWLTLAIFVLTAFLMRPAFAAEDAILLAQAKSEAKQGRYEFAFLHYCLIVRDYPGSKFVIPSNFSQAEYYFLLGDYTQASTLFQQFIQRYPDSPEKLFALAHLLKIAQLQKDEPMVHQWEKEISTLQPTSFVFRDKKKLTYRSPMNRLFKAVFRIDQIDFFQGEKLFVQVAY